MAKSLRSKSKRFFRNKKRTDKDSAFAIADALRTQRLNARLKKAAVKSSDDEEEVKEEEEEMAVDTTEEPKAEEKVSTGGERTDAKSTWRKSKGMKVRKTPKTLFSGPPAKKGKGKKRK